MSLIYVPSVTSFLMNDKYNEELKFTGIVADVQTKNREPEVDIHPIDLNPGPEF